MGHDGANRMSLLKIARMGHPVLRRPAQPVDDMGVPEIVRLMDDMVETLIDARGVGLAAPQIHESLRLIVVSFPADRLPSDTAQDPGGQDPGQGPGPGSEPEPEHGLHRRHEQETAGPRPRLIQGRQPRSAGGRVPIILANPTLTPLDGVTEGGFEGCLSIPGLRGAVPRWRRLVVTALDSTGRPVQFQAEGYEARILQHEVDHLDGVLYLDRMTDLRTLAFDNEMHHLLDDPAE